MVCALDFVSQGVPCTLQLVDIRCCSDGVSESRPDVVQGTGVALLLERIMAVCGRIMVVIAWKVKHDCTVRSTFICFTTVFAVKEMVN